MKLILNNFGKFQNISFDLTDLTVFFGSNESGKTTLHDAFFDILCNPPASNKAGKHLRERYGRKRSAKLNGLKNELSIDQYEFRALRSIRGEDLYFIPDDEKEKSWLERLQNRLFHGGLNPGDIIESLERNYIPKPGNRKVTREFNECEDNIRSEKEQLNNIIAEKDALHKERKEMEKKEKQFTKIDLEAGQLKKKIKQIESKLDFYEKLDERKRLLDRLQLISDLEQARKKLAAFASFSAEELKQFNKFTELRIHQEKELSSIEAETKLLQESLDRKKQNVEKLKQKVEVDSSLDGFANAMLDRILEFRKSTAHKIVTSWNFRFIAIPFAIFFASFFAFFLSDTFIRWTVFLACGSFAVLLFFLLCRKKVSRLDKNTHDEFLARLHDDWNTRIKEKIDLKTLEGFEREILTFRAHHSDNLRTLNSDKSDFSQQEERLHSLKRQELDIRQNLAEKDSAINEILTRNNIANRDQYLTGYAEKYILKNKSTNLK